MQPKRNPRLTQGMGYCTSQSTLLYHALRSPLRCYPKAAAARISGADRSPLSCIKLGVAKTDALLGSRAGGIKFQSHCQMWKRVVCFYDKGSSNARCATSKQAKLLFVDTCGDRDVNWIAKGGWKRCVGRKFSGKALLERKNPCVYSCQPPPSGHKCRPSDRGCTDVCYADGFKKKGKQNMQYRNWPGRHRGSNYTYINRSIPGAYRRYCYEHWRQNLAPPLQLIADEASIVKAVADYAGVEAGKSTEQYISQIGLCASAAGNY